MKKIAFISFGHIGSTLPLAKTLSEKGIEIHYFIECFSNKLSNIESTDVDAIFLSKLSSTIPVSKLGSLEKYCPNVKFHYLRLLPPMVSHKLMSRISFFFNNLLIMLYSFSSLNMKKLNCKNVILIGRNNATHFIAYHKFLKCEVLTCLHEVCKHMNPDFENPSPLLHFLFKAKKTIVVHSNNCYHDILKYPLCSKTKVHQINFGLFETWRYCKQDQQLASVVGQNYILFIGGIDRYKGLGVLYSAMTLLKQTNTSVKFVVAGKGHDPVLKEMNNMKNVKLINRYLSNIEFATLMCNCRAIICPYKTMSQSGIPQSAFVFVKPIIASDLEGFREVMGGHSYGVLCEPGNAEEFAKEILNMYNNDIYMKYCNNILEFNNNSYTYNWSYIADKYIKLLNL